MARNWHGIFAEGDVSNSLSHHLLTIPVVGRPASLLRTLIWWGASGIIDGQDLSGLPTVAPFGWFLLDGFSSNNPLNDGDGDTPWSIDNVDTIATGYEDWQYSAVQAGTHLVGPATISLGGDLVYDVTISQQRMVYIYNNGFVDSHAQRVWYAPNTVTLDLNVEYGNMTTGSWWTPPNVHYWFQAKLLFQTF
jgi:hypothetical protein